MTSTSRVSTAQLPSQTPLESPKESRSERAGGRPPKFGEPSRPVTVTLPESTLEALQMIDSDRGRAIVKLAEAARGSESSATPGVEVVEMVSGKGLLVVGPCEALSRIPFLHMVQVAHNRFLLALASGHDFKTLELAIRDAWDDLPSNSRERDLITELLSNMGKLRKSESVQMAEILLVNMGERESTGRRSPLPSPLSTPALAKSGLQA